MTPPVREAASKRTGSRTAWKSGSRKDRRRPAVSTSRLMKRDFEGKRHGNSIRPDGLGRKLI